MFNKIFQTSLFLAVCVIGIADVRADLKSCCASCGSEHENCYEECKDVRGTQGKKNCKNNCDDAWLGCEDECHDEFHSPCPTEGNKL